MDNIIVDPHFFKRKRFNRLLNVVLKNYVKGIGIDETTSIWVRPDGTAQVIGESGVLVVGPSRSDIRDNNSSHLLTAKNLSLSVFKHGDVFSY